MRCRRELYLDKGWQFRRADDYSSKFLDCQNFPTEIHRDLLHHDLIPDPFHGKNEHAVQWVGEADWLYRTKFDSQDLEQNEVALLNFEGLDTFAIVHLNGHQILQTQNMFLSHKVEVTNFLCKDNMNQLEILFKSAWLEGKRLLDEHPKHAWVCSNGDRSRLAVRKAQYHYGWDWGPCLMSCGPWRPISLEVYQCSISELDVVTHVDEDLSSATVDIKACLAGDVSREVKIEFLVSLDDHQLVREQVQVGKQDLGVTFTTKRPSLWYPARYGKQAMYNLTVSLYSSSNDLLHRKVRRFGLRKARIVQRRLEDEDGMSFIVEVNDIPIFCGGSNWIPADSFLTRMSQRSSSSYQDWITMLVQGNQGMLRVWGGGIYEADSFYDTCDELGILVWQDLMFACGNYPVNDAFLDSVKREVTSKFKELRKHPSIVIVAGNNEDYQIAEQEGLGYDPKDSNPASWLKTRFPARFIYESIIPDLAKEHMLGVHYHPGSPWGGKSSNDPTFGDIHQWNVWHGEQLGYQQWDRLCGRFVSEFGMQALPAMDTIEHFFIKDSTAERYPESSTVSFHNKAVGHDRRLGIYLTENLRYRFDPFGYYVYCTQLMQAECIASAFRLWKRQWKGPGREYCAGALVWQANDCWPCTSWSIVDYYLRPKLAYYAVKREMNSLTIGMKRTVTSIPEDEHTKAFVKMMYKIELWICNLTLERQKLTVSIRTFNLDNRACETHVDLQRNFEVSPNLSKEVMDFEIPVRNQGVGEEEQIVVYAIATNKRGQVIADTMDWPEPLKFAHILKPKLSIYLSEGPPFSQEHGSTFDKGVPDLDVVMWLNISSDVPVKGFAIEFEGHDNRGSNVLEDNGFDVFPNQPITKIVRGLETVEKPRARIRYLGSDNEEYHNLNVVGTANTAHYGSRSSPPQASVS